MSAEDFAFAIHLTNTMNWTLTEDDFEFMIELEPDGCFVLLDGSERIGLATTISFGKVGWLGNVIVSENYRGRGVGSLLVKHSLKYLKNKKVETVGLYAYIDKIPFYRKHGFEYNSDIIYLKGKGSSSPVRSHLRKAEKDDIREIIDLDSFYFGTSRKKLLEPLLLNSANSCHVSIINGHVSGFAVTKVYEGMAEVGPLICPHGCDDIAIDLLKTAINGLKDCEIYMGIPEKESVIIDTLMRSRFSKAFHLAKMFFGEPINNDYIYAAESLERG